MKNIILFSFLSPVLFSCKKESKQAQETKMPINKNEVRNVTALGKIEPKGGIVDFISDTSGKVISVEKN